MLDCGGLEIHFAFEKRNLKHSIMLFSFRFWFFFSYIDRYWANSFSALKVSFVRKREKKKKEKGGGGGDG